jgi:hypothetical protein
MPQVRLLRRLSSLLFLALLGAASAPSQTPVDPGNLPERTLFYLLWHGTPAAEVRKSNSLFSLWDDPQFARASFLDSVSTETAHPAGKAALSREYFEPYLPLLDNPFLFGYLRKPEFPATSQAPVSKTAPAPSWNGLFFIYDRTGKEALLSKAVTQFRGIEKDVPKLSELTVAGVPALKIERNSGITYWAEFGKYAVSANEWSVFEEIVNLVNGKPGSKGLSQSAAYQEAKPVLSGGVLEFFLAVPTAEQIVASSPASSTAQVRTLLSALKLDSFHSVAARVSLEGSRSRLSGAILGDTRPGSLFDIWDDGQANPVSIGYLSPNTVEYGEMQLNLLGIYKTLKAAFAQQGGSPAQSTGSFEKMVETRLGMPLPEALRLVSGEVAWIQNSPILDDSQKVYLLGIRDKPNALKLTRTLMGDQISSERNEGDATYLKVSLRGGQSSAGVTQWKFYYLAMTPRLLFGASNSDNLHAYVRQTPAALDPAQPANLLTALAKFPEKRNGFSYLDFQKVDWPGLRAKWVADANQAAQTAKSTDAASHSKKLSDWFSQVNPDVFPRHLHSMAGASWKDAKGVHFDEWLD